MKDLGIVSNYLGIKIEQHAGKGIIDLNQSDYLQQIPINKKWNGLL